MEQFQNNKINHIERDTVCINIVDRIKEENSVRIMLSEFIIVEILSVFVNQRSLVDWDNFEVRPKVYGSLDGFDEIDFVHEYFGGVWVFGCEFAMVLIQPKIVKEQQK